MSEPRVIIYKTDGYSPYARVPKPSAIFYVNHLSRQEALKVYTKVRTMKVKPRNHYPHGLQYKYDYVNPDADFFYFPMLVQDISYQWNKDIVHTVRHLVFSRDTWNWIIRDRRSYQALIVACFNRVETITILASDTMPSCDWMQWNAETIADKIRISSCNDDAFTKVVFDLWQAASEGTIVHIRNINTRYGKVYRNWQPTVEFKLGYWDFYRKLE
jgi:hypothetical protein